MSTQDVDEQIRCLKENYIDLCKEIRELNEISSSSDAELHQLSSEYANIKNILNSRFDKINSIINSLKFSESSKEISSVLNNIKLEEKYREFTSITTSVDNRLSNFVPLYPENSSNKESFSSDDPLSSKIKFKDYGNEYLQRRQKELEEVKLVSAQVASISSSIKMETFKQGEQMNEIESSIMSMNANVHKAEKEAKETEIITRGNKTKLLYLAIFLVILVIITIYAFCKMFK